MTSLQVPCMQRIWKIKNSMLQLKIRRFADLPIAKLWMMLWHWLSSEQEETDTKLLLCAQIPFDIGFERVNIVTVDTEMAILIRYFQSMLNEKIYHHFRTYSACSYSCLTCPKIVLTDKIHVKRKVENIPSHVQSVYILLHMWQILLEFSAILYSVIEAIVFFNGKLEW